MPKKRMKRFLTIYTATAVNTEPKWPMSQLLIGSFIYRGDAIRECAEYAVQLIETRPEVRELASRDKRIVDAIKKTGMSEDDIDNMLYCRDKDVGWSIPSGARRAVKDVIVDEIGGEDVFILASDDGGREYRFDVDENDVVCKDGLRLWTCVTTGIDSFEHDPEWEQAYPEVFLTEKDAVQCAIDDLKMCMDGYDSRRIKEEIADAKESFKDCGWYKFDLNDEKSRRWDIWSTPIDIGTGSGRIQRSV